MPDFGYLLITLSKQLRGNLNRALAAHDVTMTQWALLAALHRHSPQTAVAIGAMLEMDKPTVSAVVKRLTKKGLLVSEPKPDDRRAKWLRLTAAGEAAYQSCAAIADGVVDDFLAPLSPVARGELTALLTRLEGEDDND